MGVGGSDEGFQVRRSETTFGARRCLVYGQDCPVQEAYCRLDLKDCDQTLAVLMKPG